jgi:hypothetical protein
VADTVTPTRRFSLLESTSGLPDGSREEDERAAERRLRDLRGRVKAAQAVISATPGATEILHQDLVKGVLFYAKSGISQVLFRHGVSGSEVLNDDHDDRFCALRDDLNEPREREAATLPERGNGH